MQGGGKNIARKQIASAGEAAKGESVEKQESPGPEGTGFFNRFIKV